MNTFQGSQITSSIFFSAHPCEENHVNCLLFLQTVVWGGATSQAFRIKRARDCSHVHPGDQTKKRNSLLARWSCLWFTLLDILDTSEKPRVEAGPASLRPPGTGPRLGQIISVC